MTVIYQSLKPFTCVLKNMSSGSFENVINKMFTHVLYLICMYREDLALNNIQWLKCHKTQPNQITSIYIYMNKKTSIYKEDVVLKKLTIVDMP